MMRTRTETHHRTVVAGLACALALFGCKKSDRGAPHDTAPPPPTKEPEVPPSPPENPPPSPKPSLDTDDAVRAAYEKATGNTLGDHPCVDRPESFSALVIVGIFANDRGCIAQGMFVAGTWHAGLDSTVGLGAAGWAKADEKKREEMAASWVTEVLGAWGSSPQTETSKAFELSDTPAFTPPKVSTEAGRILYDAWFLEPAGMVPRQAYEHVRYSFDADGHVEEKSLESFEVRLDRLR